MKKIPQRTCICCNSKKNKNELVRLIKDKQNNIIIDLSGKINTRGTYICKDENCFKKITKSKKAKKIFETNNLEDLYLKLNETINGGELIGQN